MSNEQDKRDPNDPLGPQLQKLLKQIEDAPVSNELRLTAKKLEDALKARKRTNGRN